MLVERALADPDLLVFGELLRLPAVAALATSHSALHQQLELFAYGDLSDVAPGDEPDKPALLDKLRLLTVARAATKSRCLSLDALSRTLRTSSRDATEDVIIAAQYRGLVEGRIDAAAGVFDVAAVAGRDLRSRDIDREIVAKLRDFLQRDRSL